MTDESLRELVERQLSAVSLELHEGITTGFANALGTWNRLEDTDYRWLLSMNARARMREHWEKSLGASGWSVSGNVRLMGQTILVSQDERVTLRLLKEHGQVYPGGVPHAGHTAARQRAWLQDALDGVNAISSADEAAQAAECLLLWNCGWQDSEVVLTARVVHTIGTGRYGLRVPIDLSYEIDPTGNMHDQLQFAGDEQPDDLFPTIKREENEEDASGQ